MAFPSGIIALTLPLRTLGTKIAFRIRDPSEAELHDCEHVHVTSAPVWNPTSDIAMIQATTKAGSPWKHQVACSVNTSTEMFKSVTCLHHDASTETSMYSATNAENELMDKPARHSLVSSEQHSKVMAELLAEQFSLSERNAHFE